MTIQIRYYNELLQEFRKIRENVVVWFDSDAELIGNKMLRLNRIIKSFSLTRVEG